jgi:molybdopterin synthase sulfur carrier subunit
MCHVVLEGPMREAAGGRARLEIEASTLSELFRVLKSEHTGVADRLIQEDGRIRRHVNIFINGAMQPSKNPEGIQLKNTDEVVILPAISGG